MTQTVRPLNRLEIAALQHEVASARVTALRERITALQRQYTAGIARLRMELPNETNTDGPRHE